MKDCCTATRPMGGGSIADCLGIALGIALALGAPACSSENAATSPPPDASSPDASSLADGAIDAGRQPPPAEAGADGAGDGSAGLSITSPQFADGQPIPPDNTCAGANTSPELDWTDGPAGTQSYALVVTDLNTVTRPAPIIHWVVWDIPATVHKLPAGLPGDPVLTTPISAKQVDLRTGPDAAAAMNGYFGPCPRGTVHSYQFEIHAMDVATLPGVTTTSTSIDVKAAVVGGVASSHSLAAADLTGTSDAGPPDAGTPSDAGGQ